MSDVQNLVGRLRQIAESQWMDFDSPNVAATLDDAATTLEALASIGSVVAEEPEGPTSMKPFHREYPGSPRLFHTYCSEHPDFGTCEEEVQAHRDIADHLASEHYDVNQE